MGRDAPIPRRLVEQAIALGSDLSADLAAGAGGAARVLHGDLHYAKVLAADRSPWLAIGPTPDQSWLSTCIAVAKAVQG